MVIVAFLVGWRPNATVLEWLASGAVVLMFVGAISWASAAVGVLVKTPDAANGFTFMLLFLPYISSAFVPTDTLPSFLQGIARNQPATPFIETLRGLWMGTPIGNQAWWATAWCLGIFAVSYITASWLFRRRAAV
ncbi:MAG TPA: ABC transporter permease [Acidimicrobiia bacterium]|nr:ABC transporter permease [Acidimicrobiia bacterium]